MATDGTQALAERLREWPFLEKPDELAEAILFDGSLYLNPAEAARLLVNLDRIDAGLDALREALEVSR